MGNDHPWLYHCDEEHVFLNIWTLGILEKLLMNTPNHAERDYLISSNIIGSITHLLNHRDFSLLQKTLRLLLNMIDKL